MLQFLRRVSAHNGFSLIELLIYIAVLAFVLLAVSEIFLIVIRLRAQNNAKFTVNENGRVVLGAVRDAILDAGSASVSGVCPANTLTLTTAATTTVYQITNGVFEMAENGGPAKALTSSQVAASGGAPCLFTKIENPIPAKPTIQTKLRITYNTPGNPVTELSQEYEITVSLR
ncbi:MAG: hypothetical protein G01um101433_147 [Parcubacteria group bacterium Gr01-1014_33]|nr:MAG: hypothetical protein G01um101433_147 [Parcubacteria group bacterium Gr01-1014_33]